jgi:hypothetical protein
VKREITDHIVKGLQVVHAKKIVLPVEEEAHEIEATIKGSLTITVFSFGPCITPVRDFGQTRLEAVK